MSEWNVLQKRENNSVQTWVITFFGGEVKCNGLKMKNFEDMSFLIRGCFIDVFNVELSTHLKQMLVGNHAICFWKVETRLLKLPNIH